MGGGDGSAYVNEINFDRDQAEKLREIHKDFLVQRGEKKGGYGGGGGESANGEI